MKSKLFLILVLCVANVALAQNDQPMLKFSRTDPTIICRDSLQILNQYDASVTYQIEKYQQKKDITCLYQLAVNYAKTNHKDSSLYYLNEFINNSEDNRLIIVDRAFDSLREDSTIWKIIVSKIEDQYLASLPENSNNEFALKLFYISIAFYTYNENAFSALLDLPDSMYKTITFNGIETKILNDNYQKDNKRSALITIDSLNNIIIKYGFPTEENVGAFGEDFVLNNLKYITIGKNQYKTIKTKFQSGNFDKLAFAYLTDIYLKKHNKKQLYGTQYIYTHQKGGKNRWKKTLYKTDDIVQINIRRKEMNFKETVEQFAVKNHIEIPQLNKKIMK